MQQNPIGKIFGYTTWIWFAVSVITVLYFLLANVNTDEQFKSVLIFAVANTSAYVVLLTLVFITETGKTKLKGTDNVRAFFMQEISARKLIYIPLGLGGIFAVSLLTINSNIENASFISILSSGFILLFCFLRTHTIIIPTLIHGFYNSIIVLVREQFQSSVLSSSPINVPDIHITLGNTSSIVSQILFQNFLVASSEEMFKILVIAFFVVTLKNRFTGHGGSVIIGGVVAVVLWASYHLITALK